MSKQYSLPLLFSLLLFFVPFQEAFSQYDPNYSSDNNNQELSDFNIGLGGGYGSEAEVMAIQINMLYRISNMVSLAADYSFYLTAAIDWSAVNLNGHYNFSSSPATTFYGLAGLNYTMLSYSYSDFGFSESETGINVGLGGQFGLSNSIALYTELKYIIGNVDQIAFFGGVRFRL